MILVLAVASLIIVGAVLIGWWSVEYDWLDRVLVSVLIVYSVGGVLLALLVLAWLNPFNVGAS